PVGSVECWSRSGECASWGVGRNMASRNTVDRLPWAEIGRQHPPAAAAAGHVADRVEDFAQIHGRLAPALWRLGKQRLNALPFLIGQVGWIPLGLAGNLGHSATALSGPHPELESPRPEPPQPFSKEWDCRPTRSGVCRRWRSSTRCCDNDVSHGGMNHMHRTALPWLLRPGVLRKHLADYKSCSPTSEHQSSAPNDRVRLSLR